MSTFVILCSVQSALLLFYFFFQLLVTQNDIFCDLYQSEELNKSYLFCAVYNLLYLFCAVYNLLYNIIIFFLTEGHTEIYFL